MRINLTGNPLFQGYIIKRFKTFPGSIFDIFSLVVILITALCGFYFALNGYIEFDEGYNLQVPINLARNGIYATSYNGGRLFDPNITTGPTVLLPIAAVFAITSSTSVEAARMVMSVFFTGTLIAAWFLGRKLYGRLAGLFIALLFASLPSLANFGVSVLGEIPAAFFLLLGIIFLDSKRTGLAGLLFGLAVLTKFVFLLAGPVLLLIFFVDWLRRPGNSRWKLEAFRPAVISLSLFALPNLLWEAVKLLVLGWTGYKNNLKDFISLFKDSSGLDATSASSNLSTRIAVLATPFKFVPGWVVLFILLISFTWVFWITRQRYLRTERSHFSLPDVALLSFSCFFLAWWLFSSNLGWWRHLLPGMIVMLLPLCGFIAYLLGSFYHWLRHAFQKRAIRGWLIGIAGGIASLGLFSLLIIVPAQTQISAVQNQMKAYPQAKMIQLQVAGKINSVMRSGSVVGAWGWYQAPEISVFSKQPFVDLTKDQARQTADAAVKNGFGAYVLVSPTQTSMVPELWDDEEKYAGDLVFNMGGYQLYRYIPQDDVTSQLKSLLQREDISSFSSQFSTLSPHYKPAQIISGLYPDGWVSSYGSLWLKNPSSSTQLVVDGSVALQFLNNQPLTVYVLLMGKPLAKNILTQSGDFHWEFTIPEDLRDQPILKITFQTDRFFIPSLLGITPDGRELSFLVNLVEIR